MHAPARARPSRGGPSQKARADAPHPPGRRRRGQGPHQHRRHRGERVALKSAGVGSLKGLCPFHDEKSPSFHVRQQVGYYHCFGCGESGDVYSFLRAMDHVSFTEAVERLAGRIGYTLHYEDGGAAPETSGRSRLYAANTAAAEFFRSQLLSPDAEAARRFLGSAVSTRARRRTSASASPRGAGTACSRR